MKTLREVRENREVLTQQEVVALTILLTKRCSMGTTNTIRRILEHRLLDLPSAWYWDRLRIDTNARATYVAGQDSTRELAQIRNNLIKGTK